MKKGPLLMGLVVFSAVAGGSFAYGWHSVTHIPGSADHAMNSAWPQTGGIDVVKAPISSNWAVSQPEPKHEPSPLRNTTATNTSNIVEQLSNLVSEQGQSAVTLNAPQISQLVNEAILSQPMAAQLLANASSLTTILDSDRIETGAVLNLSDIPLEGLPTELQVGLSQLTTTIPLLAERDIYIGVVAQPQVHNGQISIDQNLSLRLGQFTLPLADVAENLGVSTNDIEERLNALINQQGFALEDIKISDKQVVITGTHP